MRAEDFLRAMSDIPEEWVIDAERAGKRAPRWLKWGSIAACLVCTLLLGFLGLSQLAQRDGGQNVTQPATPLETWGAVSAAPEEETSTEDSAEDSTEDSAEDSAEDSEEEDYSGDPMMAAVAGDGYVYTISNADGTGELRVWCLYRVTVEQFSSWKDADYGGYEGSYYSNSYPEWETSSLLSTSYQVGMDEKYVYLLDITTEIADVYEDEQTYIAFLAASHTCEEEVSQFLADHGIPENPNWQSSYRSFTDRMAGEQISYTMPSLEWLTIELPSYKCTDFKQLEAYIMTPIETYTLIKTLPDPKGFGWSLYRTEGELWEDSLTDYDMIVGYDGTYTYYLCLPEGQQWLDNDISRENYYNMMAAGKHTIARFMELSGIEPAEDWEIAYDELCIPDFDAVEAAADDIEDTAEAAAAEAGEP